MQKAQEENTNCNCSELISCLHLFLSHIPVYDQDHQRRGISCSLPAAATKFRRMYSTSVVQLGLQGLLDYLITTGDSIALHVPSLFPPCALQGPRAYLTLAQAPRGTTMCCSGLGASLPLDLISGFRIRQASFCCLLQPIFSDFFQKYILTYFLFCTHPFEPQYKEQGDHKYVKVHSYVFSLLHPSFSTPISNPLTIRFQLDPKL